MPAPVVCSEDEVVYLVHTFYAKVREDPQLGPIFEAHVDDWPHHLSKLVDFWSAALCGTSRYRGSPMVAHACTIVGDTRGGRRLARQASERS